MKQWGDYYQVSGRPGFVLSKKLRNLKSHIKVWAKEKFGRLEQRIASWENQLQRLELKEELNNLSEEDKKEKHEAKIKLTDALRDEDMFWLRYGDRCTKLFHRVMNYNPTNNSVKRLESEGMISEDPDQTPHH